MELLQPLTTYEPAACPRLDGTPDTARHNQAAAVTIGRPYLEQGPPCYSCAWRGLLTPARAEWGHQVLDQSATQQP